MNTRGSYPEWRRDRPLDARQPVDAPKRNDTGANSGERAGVREMRAVEILPKDFSRAEKSFLFVGSKSTKDTKGTKGSRERCFGFAQHEDDGNRRIEDDEYRPHSS